MDCKKTPLMESLSKVLILFLFIMCAYFLIKSELGAKEFGYMPSSAATISFLNEVSFHATKEKRAEWEKEYKFHEENGIRTYNDAKSKCWYLPRISDRDKAKNCFITAVSALGCSTPTGRLVVMVVSSLTHCGLAALDEWNYIENKLNWSQYHFDMCDHYANLLRNSYS